MQFFQLVDRRITSYLTLHKKDIYTQLYIVLHRIYMNSYTHMHTHKHVHINETYVDLTLCAWKTDKYM